MIGLECEAERPSELLEILTTLGRIFVNGAYWVEDQSLWGVDSPLPDRIAPDWFDSIDPGCIERLVLHLYPEGTPPREIDTYEEYCNSPCEAVVLIYDGHDLELYCKNSLWMDRAFNAIRAIPGVKAEQEGSDPRYRMYV